MKTRKSTKRALLLSVCSILLCFVMLIGTTFAWFTDTASTAVNTIKSGKLDIEIQDASNQPIEMLNWVAYDGRAQEDILWEPGCTYTLTPFKLVNTGSLALKYKLVVTGLDGDSELLDVIHFTYTIDGQALDLTEEGHLAAKAETKMITISATMDTTAGNEYQGKSLNGVKFNVYATQDTVEYDSTTNQYDKDAAYTEVIAAGKEFTGKATVSTGITATDPNAIAVKAIGADADVTIEGGSFDGGNGGNNICVAAANGATVTIKGGTFTVGGDADGYGNSVIYSQGGNIVIEGGFFYTNYNYRGYYYVLNQSNGNPGTITVKGGTFVNYDPSKGDDNLGGNFVADGYKVVSETKANGDVWYTVVKDTKVATADELTEAVKAGGNITLTSDISLASNDPRTAALKIPADTDVTIDLNGKTVNVTSGNFVMIPSGSKLTISGGTVVSNRYVFEGEGGEVVVNGGSYTAQETVCALFGGSTLTVNDGTFTSKDNAVVATNGSSAEGCNITINGGTFNANIFTPGYIACGIYVANKDTVNVNAGTFNIKDGVGILMRAGHTTIGKNVVINLNNTGKVTAGKIGDANINITTPSHLVIDVRSNYPGLTEGYSVTNNTAYQLVEYK